MRFAIALAASLMITACAKTPETPTAPPVETVAAEAAPMAWDHRAESDRWTLSTRNAVQSHGAALTQTVPDDIASWCPGYTQQDEEGRALFWTAMLSALARHESTWNPAAVGGGGKWFGLVQIAPATARGYNCRAKTGNALKDGVANLSCAVRIAAHTVPRDGVVAARGRGLAADWGPFHSASKREQMRQWVRQQPYCQAR